MVSNTVLYSRAGIATPNFFSDNRLLPNVKQIHYFQPKRKLIHIEKLY